MNSALFDTDLQLTSSRVAEGLLTASEVVSRSGRHRSAMELCSRAAQEFGSNSTYRALYRAAVNTGNLSALSHFDMLIENQAGRDPEKCAWVAANRNLFWFQDVRLLLPNWRDSDDTGGRDVAGPLDIPSVHPSDGLPRLAHDRTIGYWGHCGPNDGSTVLLEACDRLIQCGARAKLLMVGSARPDVMHRWRAAAVDDKPFWLVELQEVSYDKAAELYPSLDVLVFPRSSSPLIEMLPPVRVAEALSHGKRVVVSDAYRIPQRLARRDGVVTFEADSVDRLMEALAGGAGRVPAPSSLPGVAAIADPAPASGHRPKARRLARSPLKTFSVQSMLRNDVAGDVPFCENASELISIRKGQHHEITDAVTSGEEYALVTKCIGSNNNPKGVVADITFFDDHGNPLPQPYPGLAHSPTYGSYTYVPVQQAEGASYKSHKFQAPQGAKTVSVKLVAFGPERTISIAEDSAVVHEKTRVAQALEASPYRQAFLQALEEANAIPDSNGSEYFEKYQLRVGVIGDVYMYNFYKDVFSEVSYLSPTNYPMILQKGLDLVVYTTCWKGIHNEEWKGIKFREAPRNALRDILAHAKKSGIKTLFQSIEDPSNFEYFLPVAEQFDYVFTTDTDCIDRYKAALGHDRVFFGEYGVNPQFNNPIGCRRNIRNAAFFAGSYPRRYEERCRDMEIIFDSIVDSGGELLIADRNFGAGSENLEYPERFRPNVLPPVDHAILQKMHKLFRYNLNFNSIKQSPTMCAMRVYELQAQGNGIISNYAKSVFNKFPAMRIMPYRENMEMDFASDESWFEYRANMASVREVLNTKTSYQVVGTLLANIGLDSNARHSKTVAVICRKKSPEILRSFEVQSYPDKVLIEEAELDDWDTLVKSHSIGYFCWFSPEHRYEKHYLIDLLNGFKYTDSLYITKHGHFDADGCYVSGEEHEYTDRCAGKALSLFSARYLSPSKLKAWSISESFDLPRGYSIDPFEVNFVRYMQRNNHEFREPRLSVIVPVYNNGRFLVGKCLPSLMRNRLWPRMEVLLIDDGSNDADTLATVRELEMIYPNVVARFNHDGGSGSASRPRNQGIDMASASLLTFLDPDNEIAPGTYDLLVELYEEANRTSPVPVDFISGFHVKVDDDVKVIGRHTRERLSLIRDFQKGYFARGRFPVIATQSGVIAKTFLDAENIRFVEGSAGQDTLFGWELIARAKCGGFTGEAFLIYYADRSDSVTNEIDQSYFAKKLILERRQKQFLEEVGILEPYMEHHFDRFMREWYLKKLESVRNSDRDVCLRILGEICRIYGKNLGDYISSGLEPVS